MQHPEVDWLAKWALYTPENLFLRDHAREVQWNFKEGEQRARQVAAALQTTYGIERGDRVAVLSTNRSEYVYLMLACVKLGAILVPLNFRLTAQELNHPLEDAQPALVIYESGLEGKINRGKWVATEMSIFDNLVFGALDEVATFKSDRPGQLDDLAMILFTSGTTGVPKGAMITHRMLLWNAINTELRLDLNSEDHSLSFAPFFHTGGWNVLLTPFLHCGASHTLLPGFDPDLIMQLFQEEKVSIFFGVPTMLRMLAETEGFASADLESIRYSIVGGAPMPEPLINTWHEKGVFIRQGYGLTEVGPNCFSLHQDHAVSHRGSIGFPNFYVEARIVDDTGQECGPDEVGELCLRSEVVTPGYWLKPEETEKAIVDGWFHTGDLVKRDAEGFHTVVDRKKNMYISGGENVYPAEVEAALLTHPAVSEAAVIGVPDPTWGEAGHAFLVLHQDQAWEPDSIREFCSGCLAKFKIPRELTVLKALPLNDAGKIDRAALRQTTNYNEEK